MDNLFDVVAVAGTGTAVVVLVVASSLLAPLMATVVALFPSLSMVVAVDDVAPPEEAPPLVAVVAAAALSLCSAPATPLAAFVVRVTLRILEVARLLPFGGEVAMEVLVAAVDAVELRMTSMD